MGRSWVKFRLLMWKNWLLQIRHKRTTAIEILVPVIFTALLVIIRTLVDVEIQKNPITYTSFNPLHFPIHNLSVNQGPDIEINDTTNVDDGTQEAFCKLLVTGEFTKMPEAVRIDPFTSFLRKEDEEDPWARLEQILPGLRKIMIEQWIIVYSPNSPLIKDLMKSAAQIKPFVGCGLKNETALEDLLTLPRFQINPTSVVLAGVVFDDNLLTATEFPKNLDVQIRFPGERRVSDLDEKIPVEKQGGSQNTLNWMTGLLFPLFQIPGPRNKEEIDGGSPGYYKEGFLGIQTAISEAILKINNIKHPEIQLQRFPYPPYVDDPLLQAMEGMIPLIIMLSFVYSAKSTVSTVTTEKEKQLKEAMKMMGLPNWLHWTAWFLKTFLLYLVSIIFITILMKAPLAGPDMYVIERTDWSCLFVFLFCYIIAGVTFCFAISVFFSKASNAAIVGGLVWFLCYFPYVFFQNDYANTPLGTKLGISIFCNSGMAYGFQIILMYEGTGAGLQWSNLWTPVTPNDTLTMGHIMGMLLVDAIVYMIITIYVEGVYPGEFGVPLPWYFPFTKSYWLGEPLSSDQPDLVEDDTPSTYMEPDPKKLHAGIQIKKLRKVYGNGKVAVHGLTLNLYEGQITVLLGHNGAGKTTTMSMLTGMYTPTSGTANISGHDIRTDMDGAREKLGLCPQHNILFDELTVKEHLDFFGKLKGLEGRDLINETDRFIAMLELENKRNAPSKSLSGGMKRKLSAAVALCGGSKVVLFDEPTSGMDPAARRALWDLLQAEKTGRTVLLTTHFMDEADLLGDRIAIMSEGRLKAVGSSFFLKKKFGGGYRLIMVKENDCRSEKVTDFLSKYIPGIKTSADVGAELSYHLDDSYQSQFETMFNELEEAKTSLGISSYGVSLTTMEEVFMKVGSDEEMGKTEHDNNVSAISINGNGKSHATVNVEEVELVKHPKLLLNQAWAMLLKYMTSTYRNWILYLIIIIIPILDLSIAILIGKTYQGTNDLPARSFTLKDYKEGVVTLATLDGGDSALAATYRNLVTQQGGVNKDLNEMNYNLDVSGFILNESAKDVGFVSQTYMLGTIFNSTIITAMFNNQPLHIPPLALGLVYNAILQTYSTAPETLNFVNKPLPYTAQTKVLLQQQGGNMGFQIAFNLGFSFAFVASYFIVFYIRERVAKAKHLQFVSGVNIPTFWSVAFLWDIVVALGPLIGIILTLLAWQQEGYTTAEELGRTFAVMISSMVANIPLSYLASFWFDIPAAGFSRMILIHIFTGIATYIVVLVLQTPSLDLVDVAKTLDWIFTFMPVYSLTYSFQNLNTNYLVLKVCENLRLVCDSYPNICCKEESKCGPGGCVAYTENYFAWDQPGIGRNIFIFFIDGAVFFAILMIIEHRLWEMVGYRSTTKTSDLPKSETTDNDVLRENEKVANLSEDDKKKYNLLLRNVSKDYKNFRAVNNLNLVVEKGQCFGLLGVNGAGKTTTFKMLTGDEIITQGDGYVQGLSLKYKMKQVHQLIGYCPQFDALLDDLTGRETIRIFSLLRGVPPEEIPAITEKLAKDLLFYQHIDKKVKEYSGGNKRKLSTAVALIGDPPVVYLDEPTTGMDPVAKRHLWDVICSVRDQGKTIILTSHSMEECEALCTRLAIMVNGEFLCLGSTQHLKDKYAEGYTLIIKVRKGDRSSVAFSRSSFASSPISATSRPSLKRMDSAPTENDLQPIKTFVSENFAGASLSEEYQGLLTYKIPRGEATWAHMFGLMETAKVKLDIEDYSLGQTSLEQVFLSFTKYQNNRNDNE